MWSNVPIETVSTIELKEAFEETSNEAETVPLLVLVVTLEKDTFVIPVSVMCGRGMKEAHKNIIDLVNKMEKRNPSAQEDEETFGNKFMQSRAVIDEMDEEEIQYPGSEQ